MKKTISISLANQKFTLEEDAYHKLTTYLEEIKASLDDEVDSAEVITDIEQALAEKMKALLSKNKETINFSDVESLIKIMGTKEDFARDMGTEQENSKHDSQKEKTQAKPKKKILYRDIDNSIIAGVCAGLGNYFDIDPNIFRVIFVILVFFSGSGIVLYLVLWLFIPEAQTNTQKLEMHGKETTVESLKDFLRQKKEEGKGLMRKNSSRIRAIIHRLVQIFRKIIGFLLVLISLISIGAILFGGITLLLYRHSNYLVNFIPTRELASLFPFNLLLLSSVLAVIIPCIFILLVGLATFLKTKRRILNFKVVAILVALWMFSGISVAVIGTRYFPEAFEKIDNYPTIQPTKITLPTESIQTLKLDGRITAVYNSNATNTQLIISGRKIDLNYLQIKNSTDTIEIIEKSYSNHDFKCIGCDLERVTVLIPKDSNLQILTSNGAHFIKENFSDLPEPDLPNSPEIGKPY